MLLKAGIQHAKGIFVTLSTDSENVFTVLTARQMNADIYIVSKAGSQPPIINYSKPEPIKPFRPTKSGDRG
jgi:voltage-gated potassium channel